MVLDPLFLFFVVDFFVVPVCCALEIYKLKIKIEKLSASHCMYSLNMVKH